MQDDSPLKIGYFVPEFPGQTHIFFWRELRALREAGAEPQVVSTRRPPQKIVSHEWAQEAMRQTTYLVPFRFKTLMASLREGLRGGPGALGRCLGAIRSAEGLGLKGRLRLAALALAGAHLSWLARTHGWMHVHVHSCADAAHVAMFAHLLSGLPYSLTLHGPLSDYGPNQRNKWRHAKFAIVITRKLLGEVRRSLDDALPGTVEVAPMGVELRQFARSTPYRAFDGVGRTRIFSCGRLNPCKGHDDLIRAIALLRDDGLDVELKIAGEDDSHGEYRARLTALIAELKLEDRVQLLGAVSEEKVRAGLEESHLFALASLHEPLGVAIMEAMAMELPVVVTGAGGVRELVADGADGLLVEPRDPQQMADAIRNVLRDPDLAERLGKAARTKVMEAFDSSVSALAMVNNACATRMQLSF